MGISRRLVLVVEATSVAGAAWPMLRETYVTPLTRSVLTMGAEGEGEVALIVFGAREPFSASMVHGTQWTSSEEQLKQYLDNIEFQGGGARDTALADAMVEALHYCGAGHSNEEMAEVAHHCLLVAHSSPSPLDSMTLCPMPTLAGIDGGAQQWTVANPSQIAGMMLAHHVSFSLVAAHQDFSLKELFDQAQGMHRGALGSAAGLEPRQSHHILGISQQWREGEHALAQHLKGLGPVVKAEMGATAGGGGGAGARAVVGIPGATPPPDPNTPAPTSPFNMSTPPMMSVGGGGQQPMRGPGSVGTPDTPGGSGSAGRGGVDPPMVLWSGRVHLTAKLARNASADGKPIPLFSSKAFQMPEHVTAKAEQLTARWPSDITISKFTSMEVLNQELQNRAIRCHFMIQAQMSPTGKKVLQDLQTHKMVALIDVGPQAIIMWVGKIRESGALMFAYILNKQNGGRRQQQQPPPQPPPQPQQQQQQQPPTSNY